MELLNLSNEMLDAIFAHIPFDVFYPRTIYGVMLTCRRLFDIAMPLLYSRLAFNFKNTGDKMVPYSSNPFNKYDKMLEVHPQRASWAVLASFTYSWTRHDLWDNLASILPKLSLLQTLKIGAGLGHIDPFHDAIGLGINDCDRQTIIDGRDSKFIQLLKRCNHLHSLHTVCLMDRCITLQEARAFFALPNIRVLEMRILDEIYSSFDEDLTLPEPSKLAVFKLVSEMLPSNRTAKRLFQGLSSLKDVYWSTEETQPLYFFSFPWPPPQDHTWSPKDIEQAIYPCRNTLSRLQLYNNIPWQNIILPNIDFHEFSALTDLKLSARLLFTMSLASDLRGRRKGNRYDFAKRLPRNIEQLEL